MCWYGVWYLQCWWQSPKSNRAGLPFGIASSAVGVTLLALSVYLYRRAAAYAKSQDTLSN
jgi:hypothetical protein